MSAEELVRQEIQALRAAKDLGEAEIGPNSILLGEELGLDSLDLASLVVSLEERTGLRPFERGFVMFQTVGELVVLFSRP